MSFSSNSTIQSKLNSRLKKMDLSPRTIANQNWSGDNFKKQVTSMNHITEPAIQSCDTGQRMPFFDSCILTMDVQCQVEHKKYALDSKLVSVPFPIRQHEGEDVRTYVRTILSEPEFLGCIGNHNFLTYGSPLCALRAHESSANKIGTVSSWSVDQ